VARLLLLPRSGIVPPLLVLDAVLEGPDLLAELACLGRVVLGRPLEGLGLVDCRLGERQLLWSYVGALGLRRVARDSRRDDLERGPVGRALLVLE